MADSPAISLLTFAILMLDQFSRRREIPGSTPKAFFEITGVKSTGVLSNCPFVITVICILTGMFALFGIL